MFFKIWHKIIPPNFRLRRFLQGQIHLLSHNILKIFACDAFYNGKSPYCHSIYPNIFACGALSDTGIVRIRSAAGEKVLMFLDHKVGFLRVKRAPQTENFGVSEAQNPRCICQSYVHGHNFCMHLSELCPWT